MHSPHSWLCPGALRTSCATRLPHPRCTGINNVHLTPALELSKAFSGFTFGFIVLFCGFLQPEPQIPDGWIWVGGCQLPGGYDGWWTLSPT